MHLFVINQVLLWNRANGHLSSNISVLFLENDMYLSVYENPPRPKRCL